MREGALQGRWATAGLVAAGILLGAAVALRPTTLALAVALLAVAVGVAAAGTRSTVMQLWALLFVVFYDRLATGTNIGGGSGLLPLALPITVLIGALAFFARSTFREALATIFRRGQPLFWYVVTGAALPFISLLVGAPYRVLLGVLVPLSAGIFAVLGAEMAQRSDSEVLMGRLILAATALQAFFVVVQISRFSGLALPGSTVLARWDVSSAALRGVVLSGSRAVGAYLNPNVVGLQGGVAVAYAVAARNITTRVRAALLVTGAILLLGAQSRGVVLALIGVVVIVLIVRLVQEGPHAVGAPAVLAAGALAAVLGAMAVFAPSSGSVIGARLAVQSILNPTSISSTTAFVGRVTFWKSALNLFLGQPLGTLSSPEAALGSAIDNDYIRVLLQGGIVYLTLYIWQYLFVVIRGLRSHAGIPFASVGLLMLFAAISQTVSVYPPFIVFYMMCAGVAVAQAGQRVPE